MGRRLYNASDRSRHWRLIPGSNILLTCTHLVLRTAWMTSMWPKRPERQQRGTLGLLHVALHPSINMTTTTSHPRLKAAILVVSETASKDPSTDQCIPTLQDVFRSLGNGQWDVSETEIVPDSVLSIQKAIRAWSDGERPVHLIVTSGGTGFATKDVTPEVSVFSFASCAE